MHLVYDSTEITFTRTYNSIFDILGGLGGLYNILIFSFNQIIVNLVKLNLNKSMANKIFLFFQKNSNN